MFSSDKWFGSTPSFYNGVATQSLRFDDGSSEHLTFTPSSASSATDRRKITHAVWIKRGNIGTSQTIYGTTKNGGGDYYSWRFNADNTMTIYLDVADSNFAYDGTEVYRDISSFYHFVLIIDTTQSSASNRIKLYANGVQQTLSNKYGSDVSQNFETYVMDGNEDAIGEFNYNNSTYFDGYMCDFITTVGQDNSISDFGETKNGVWIAKKYSGSYGANGFRLEFKQTGTGTASSSTIGADTSGNNNHFTSNNLSAHDCVIDSPENNFSTWNLLKVGGGAKGTMNGGASNRTFAEGNLSVSLPANTWAYNSQICPSGKWYAEICVKTIGSTNGEISWGWHQYDEYSDVGAHGGYTNNWQAYYHAYSTDHIKLYDESSQLGSNINLTLSAGDILQLAWDIDNRKGWLGINNTWYRTDATDGNPSAGTNQTFDFTEDEAKNLAIMVANGTSTDVHILNTGQDSSFAGTKTAQGNTDTNGIGDFFYSVPTGFQAVCAKNLEEPTIGANSDTQADDHFTPYIWTGNGSNPRAFTDVGFQADWIWIKRRTGSTGTKHHLQGNSTIGDNKTMLPNEPNPESAPDANGTISDTTTAGGFTVNAGATSDYMVNTNGSTYVAWLWKANAGITSSNSEGTTTSTVQANTTAGFSIINYDGNSSSRTIGHGLNSAPEWVIVKTRATERWTIFHTSISNGYIYLNENFALQTGNADERFGDSSSVVVPNSTVITLGANNSDVNQSGENYIMYCFHSVEGYSKFGSFVGNGSSSDGQFIYLGFKPSWIMIKKTSNTDSWEILDNQRPEYNQANLGLFPNTDALESSSRGGDIVSNGFKHRNANGNTNENGNTYIYMAFGSSFKYATAR